MTNANGNELYIVERNGIETAYRGIAQAIISIFDTLSYDDSIIELVDTAREYGKFGQGVILFTDKDEPVRFRIQK